MYLSTRVSRYYSQHHLLKEVNLKYYAACLEVQLVDTDTTSGRMMCRPCHLIPLTNLECILTLLLILLENDDTNYISLNFPNGLLYCCLSEAYGFLKGPIDMLTLYENKYKQEVQKFANEQVGRRRRDDYTDGAVRIPINSANP